MVDQTLKSGRQARKRARKRARNRERKGQRGKSERVEFVVRTWWMLAVFSISLERFVVTLRIFETERWRISIDTCAWLVKPTSKILESG